LIRTPEVGGTDEDDEDDFGRRAGLTMDTVPSRLFGVAILLSFVIFLASSPSKLCTEPSDGSNSKLERGREEPSDDEAEAEDVFLK
jgi:hypothetical protein